MEPMIRQTFGYEPTELGSVTLPPTRSRRDPPSARATALVFSDPASQALRQELERVAPSDVPVVIIGETGTGKELVARFLHERSQRAERPFIAVNCGAMMDSLVEAELFGYEKGAFTGASQSQVGWFEAAHGGTLLLDEIGDLPLSMQVKLLRVLQEREVVRLGSRRPVAIDVRVIAATNVDLAAAVEAGRFREDLFFRLNVAPVTLSPLRDRPGDILPLAQHFLARYGKSLERPGLSLSPAAEKLLLNYAWPGNIREMENVIHYAVLIARGGAIDAADLRLVRSASAQQAAGLEGEIGAIVARHLEKGTPNLFDRVTEATIRAGYDGTDQNQVRAAERLGITRNILRTHLARLGVIAGRGH